MAEERNVGLVRASEDSSDVDPTKAELQRRMEEARESISQTVSEIKDTVVTQYQQVKDTINDTLDWREQYKRHTLPFTVGAFAAGALLGYGVMGAFKGGGADDEEEFDRDEQNSEDLRPYAASPVIGRARPASSARRGEAGEDVGPTSRPSYSSGYSAATAQQAQGLTSYADAPQPAQEEQEEEEPKGPGLIERFKETKAYDRLTDELSTVGERVVEELSRTAQTVVVPLLLNKLKSLIGVDLSGQRGGGSQQRGGGQASGAQPSGGAQQQPQGSASTGAGAQASPSRPAPGSDASTPASGGSSARAAGAGGTEGHGAS
jgi:hypothetical protein